MLGALRPLPRTLLGVPLDLEQLAASGVLSDDGLERVRHETVLPPPESDVSVADLALRLGFSEPSAFMRAFRAWTGQTPGTYRQTHRALS